MDRRTLLAVLASAPGMLATRGAFAAPLAGEIRIGGLAFLTGRFSSYGVEAQKGLKIAVDTINVGGGILGRKLVVDLQDTQSDSAQAISLLRRFAGSDDVVAVVGPIGTPDMLAILPVAAQLDLAILSVGSQKTMAKSDFPPDLFRVCLIGTPQLIRSVLDKVAAAKNIKRIGLFTDRSNDSSQAESKAVRDAMGLGTGLELVAQETYTSGDKDFSVLIGKMLRANVDAMYLSGTTNEDVIIIPQARTRGFKGVFLGGATLTDPKIVQLVGAAAPPYVMFTPFDARSDRPVVVDFVAAYRKAYDTQVATYAAYAYDAVMLVKNALIRAGAPDRKAVLAAMGTTKDFQGVTGDYSFDGRGDNTTPEPYIMEVGPSGTFIPMK